MYQRTLKLPKRSFFLLGPRGCGKSTWLKMELADNKSVLRFDLLRTSVFLELQANPSYLRSQIELHNPQWVIIDEIQKLPNLLDEVHAIIEDIKHPPLFALTGSSARKLKRSNANMLAGRAISREMYPFTAIEQGADFDLEQSLKFGSIALVACAKKKEDKIDILEAYVETYLKEEIQQETKLRNLSAFHRFLQVCAVMNGQQINFTNIGSDAQVKRTTVTGYFEVLVDTLVASLLPAYQAKTQVREISTPKFYFFDCGIVNALKKNLRDQLSDSEKGFLLETYIYHELRATNKSMNWGAEIFYWATPTSEIDFIIKSGKHLYAIEVKYAKIWRPNFSKNLHKFNEAVEVKRSFGLYTGASSFKKNGIEIYPVEEFLKKVLPTLFS
jgi:predicted AAA+ superfamily ATPase